jgi:HlyD family secretion protein/adhesin transport system membrane fusion protein
MSNNTDNNNDKNTQSVRRGDRQTRYLAQSVILEEAGSSGLIRIAIITVSLIICFFVIWAAITNVDEVAVTSGEIVPTGRVQTIQHLEGGIISEILVKDGAIVEAGQALIILNPASVSAELTQQQVRLMTLDLQTERLRAMGEGREPDFAFATNKYNHLVSDQLRIHKAFLAAAVNRRSVLEDQIRQRESELSIFREEEETLLRNLQILEEEYAMREALYEKGLSSKMVYLDVQRSLNDAIGDLAKLTSERKKTSDALKESHNRLLELDTDLREAALGEMGDLMAETASLRESIRRIEDRFNRLEIKSPVYGIIKGLEANTIGGVVPPGGVLMEIVPLDEELIIETRIIPRDVGHVKQGQPVTIKVTTYDFARYGGIDGILEDVSATTFMDEEGAPYYRGVIKLDKLYVGVDETKNLVLPGMTVQADIKTGKKTLLEYLLKPVVSSVNESFRER